MRRGGAAVALMHDQVRHFVTEHFKQERFAPRRQQLLVDPHEPTLKVRPTQRRAHARTRLDSHHFAERKRLPCDQPLDELRLECARQRLRP